MAEENKIAAYLQDQWSIEIGSGVSMDEIKEKLSRHIHNLINNDFPGLINMLYKVDVSEYKLKNLLKENSGHDAGNIIATLIIERQLQKIKSRENLKSEKPDSDEERW